MRLTRIVRATSGLALGSFVLLLLGPSWVTDADEFSHWYEAPPASVHRFVGRVCFALQGASTRARRVRASDAGVWSLEFSIVLALGYLVDPASSHMLVSKIKPCMSKYKRLYCETANGSLNQLWFI